MEAIQALWLAHKYRIQSNMAHSADKVEDQMIDVILFIFVINGGIIEGPAFKTMDDCMAARKEIVMQTNGWVVSSICVPANRVLKQ